MRFCMSCEFEFVPHILCHLGHICKICKQAGCKFSLFSQSYTTRDHTKIWAIKIYHALQNLALITSGANGQKTVVVMMMYEDIAIKKAKGLMFKLSTFRLL